MNLGLKNEQSLLAHIEMMQVQLMDLKEQVVWLTNQMKILRAKQRMPASAIRRL